MGERRFLEARLTGGFRFGTRITPSRGKVGAGSDWKVLAAAAGLQQAAGQSHEAETQSALAAAHLVLGEADEAIQILEPLVRGADPDARVLNDLSAALLTRASATDRSEDLLAALEYATRAAEIGPALPEAIYNRGLALQALGLEGEARQAWERLSSSEPDPGWRQDAATRLAAVGAPPPDFDAMERRLLLAVDRDAPLEIDAAVRAQVGMARDVFDLQLLPAVSSRTKACRRLAASYRRVTGDAYQEAALDIVPPSRLESRAQLFAKARHEHDAGRRGMALPLFESVVAAGTPDDPLSLWSRMLLSGARQDTGAASAGAVLDEVIRTSESRSYSTLLGRALWLRGIISIGEARYDGALDQLSRARAVLEAAQDSEFGPYMELMRAQAFSAIGNESRSRRSLVDALRGRSRLRQPSRRFGVLLAADQEMTAAGLPRASRSFLAEARPLVATSGIEFAPLEWQLDWSRARERERPGQGLAELREGSALLERIKDPALHSRLDMELAITRGELSVPESNVADVTVVRTAIDAATARRSFFLLPNLHLNAGLLMARAGRHLEARRDFEEGLRFFERAQSLEDDLLLSSAYRALGLYGALIDELVDSGAAPEASLAVADRAYALTFDGADALKQAGLAPFAAMPTSAAVVAYFVAPRGVVAWVVTRTSVTVHRLPKAIEAVRALDDAESWLAAPAGASTSRLENLGEALLHPLEDRLRGVSRVVVVPHGRLNNVPFGGLRAKAGAGPWGAEVALSIAPSVRYAVQQRPARPLRAALIVGDPDTQARMPRLPGARSEAELLRGLYPDARVLVGQDAALERFVSLAPGSDALHLGAHAEIDRRFPSRSHILLSGDGSSDLRADRIAKLRLSRVGLVTLAACESGWTTDGSAGTFSLARPFLRAGAGSVVASLIPVSDADSAAAFGPFVQGVLRGVPPSRALQDLYKSRDWPARLGWLTLYGSLGS